MSTASRDSNDVPSLLGVSSTDGTTPITLYASPVTHRLLVDLAGGGSGTVQTVSVASANGFAGTSDGDATNPVLTLSTTINSPVLKGNGTAISAAATTGSGSTVVLNTGPTITDTLTLGVALATTGAIAFKGLTSGTLTLSAADAAGTWTMKLPTTGGTNLYFLQTNGSGVTTWAAGNAGTVTTVSVATANGFSGTVANATTTPAITIIAGAITPTSVNGLTISTTTGTFTLTNGKTFSVAKSLTLDGTDSTTMTFPTTSATIARTDAANTFTGASTASAWVLTSPTITTSIVPTSDDGAALGNTTHNFSDLFLATGAVINYQNGNVVLTHSSGILTMGTGELRITSANVGTNADSVPSLSSTSTLTNKRITPRVLSAAAYTTDTGSSINGDTQDMFIVTAQTGALKFNNPSGTPTDGQKLIITVASSTTAARALTWDTAYGSTTVTLPSTTAATTVTLSIGFIWSASKSLWQCVAVA